MNEQTQASWAFGINHISPAQQKTIDAMKPLGFFPWHSGGGCTALRKGESEKDFWLITCEDDPSIPAPDEAIVACHYSDEYEHEKELSAGSLTELIEKLDAGAA